MKKIIILSTFLLLILTVISCYEDRSTLADIPIEEVEIDTTGISGNIYITQQDILKLAPKFKHSNPNSLRYQWSLSNKPEQQSGAVMQPIGDKAELNYKVLHPISSNPYRLQITVTDPIHNDLQYTCHWNLYVQGAFISGLLIADTKDDGKSSDFTYIKNRDFSGTYKGDEVILRDILASQSNIIKGRVASLLYNTNRQFYHPRHISQLWATTTDGDLIRYNTKDFSVNGSLDKNSLILYRPSGLQVKSMFKAADGLFAQTTHGIYNLNPDRSNVFTVLDPILKEVEFSNDVIALDPNDNVKSNSSFVWLEKKTGAFMVRTKKEKYGKYVLESYTNTSSFDPNKLSDNEALAGEISFDQKTAIFLLKDRVKKQYAIYTLTQGEINKEDIYVRGSAKEKFVIPPSFNEKMEKAVSYILNKRVNILYVVTTDHIYVVTYGLGNSAVASEQPVYTVSAGEQIKKAKLFVQGQYAARANDMWYFKELPYNLNAITIITEKKGKDIVYVVPFAEDRTKLEKDKEHRYDGFGKVLDVISIGM